MDFPETLKLKDLERTHPEYELLKECWGTLAAFREGPAVVSQRKEDFLPRRPGEDLESYRWRLSKFAYTPVMDTELRTFSTKLLSAPLHLVGTEGPEWSRFLEQIDGTLDLNGYLLDLFSRALYFGRVFVATDLPETLGVRSRLESQGSPYFLTYDPLAVTDWGQGWYKTYQVSQVSQPFGPPQTRHLWTYWTDSGIYRYQWLKDGSKTQVPLVQMVPTSENRMTALRFEGSQWLGAQLYLKQKQHLVIESSWTESGAVAGIVQRVFNPQPPVPADDPRYLMTVPTLPSNLDSQHVLVGAGFSFVESTGAAIASLTGQLETIERQMRDIVTMGGSQVAPEASGLSKAYDTSLLESNMRAFGLQVAKFLQTLLQKTARMSGWSDLVSVQGLDSYTLDTLGEMVELTTQMLDFADGLPRTSQRVWIGKLAGLMTGTLSPEDQEAVNQELEETYG